jgi:hypothetical protein
MIDGSENRMELKPLFFGRVSRMFFGVGTFVLIWAVGVDTLTFIGTGVLVFLGVSFLIGGLMGNPGCELTAIPNLFRSKENQIQTR